MTETEAYVQRSSRTVAGLDSHGERPHRAGDYSFNNIGISSFFMLSSTMPDELRAEKGYYTVGGCGGNIAWHTENDMIDIADRDILLRDIKVYLAMTVPASPTPKSCRSTGGRQPTSSSRRSTKYQQAAGDGVRSCARRASAGLSLDKALDGFYAAVEAGQRAGRPANDGDPGPGAHPGADQLHARLRASGTIPAMPIPPLPTIALAAELERPSDRQGRLRQGRN